MPLAIRDLRAWEILDSRGRPALAVAAELDGGARGVAHVPSGASTGAHEALELRDGDPHRYAGAGVLRAATNVEEAIAAALYGMDALDQAAVDRAMIALDGTPSKSRLGANAILGVSCAVARAAASARGVELWRHLAGHRAARIPVPMVNILSGGLHAGGCVDFQDFLAIPSGFATFADALEAVVAVHRAARQVLEDRGIAPWGVADEGGWGPRAASNQAALDALAAAIARANLEGRMSIALDVAASHFYRDGVYRLASEGRELTSDRMIGLLEDWCARYPIVSIEDALAEDDWGAWRVLTARLGDRVQLVGDDLFVTHPERLRRGVREKTANAVLVKMNQIGTLTETFEVVDLARASGFGAVISARSGETEDSFLADLAVASGAGQIKIGSVTRSERLAKYNRLLEIERGPTSPIPFSPGPSSYAER
jgi:enolase